MSQVSSNPARRATVFISYHRVTGKAFVEQLQPALTLAGHEHWIDTIDIKGGDEWINEIVAGISRADALLVVVTPEAMRSVWVRREIEFAEQKKKRIIPCLLQPITPEDFFRLNNYQGVSFAGRDFDTSFVDLSRALQAIPLATTANSLPTQRAAELAYLDRLKLEELINTDKYTPLSGASQQQMRPAEMRAVFELLPLRLGKAAKEPHALAEPRRFENAVDEILKLRRAVLLGEPGAGKTTTLWKLAAELVERARQDATAPLPLLIRLGRWTGAEQALPDFIAGQLGELGAHLDTLLKTKRAALLLDGLNELPAAQHALKYPLVQQFIEQSARQHSQLLAVVSCRALDYTIDLKCDRINITPLDPLRIREFVTRYLGEEQGEALFWKLAGEEARQQLARFTQKFADKLAEPERVFWIEQQLPTGLYWGYEWQAKEHNDNSYWQRWLQQREQPSSLMVLARNPYMLLMLASVYAEEQTLPTNRGELFRLFVETLLQRERIPEAEQQPLTAGLAQVAYEMQMRRASNDQDGGALTVLPKAAVLPLLGERLLYLAGCASLLGIGDEVRFTHQLLQEYFAAKYMDLEIAAGRLRAADLWPAARWWERNNWEEAAILLAGLYSDDCTPVVDWLADAQPELAAQCINRSGARLALATRERLRAKWLPRLTDVQREPNAQASAAIGRALGDTGLDNRPGVGSRADGLPDIAWVEIPGGAFQYGAEKQAADEAWFAPAKPQKLTLPTFWMSRYPITYLQFRVFQVDPAGYHDPRWWAGLAADETDRQPLEQAFMFANHPRDTVNWYEAVAFCRWLSWRWGGGYDLRKIDEWKVRLPTEYEWEKAARGMDGRLYPYGNKFDAAKGNVRETGIRQSSAVGIFPNGASPYGVEEMSGNVWEWCLSDYDKPQLEARKEKLTTDKRRVLRGGSWLDYDDGARAVFRDGYAPGNRFSYIGFRVVVGVPPS